MSADIDEMIERLKSKKGVMGVLVIDWEGRAIKSTFDQEDTNRYADVLQPYVVKSREMVKQLDAANDLTYVRLRSKKHEIMIAPDKDYIMAVVQTPV